MEIEKKSNGALVGLVVIIIILVIGGIYMWQSKKDATQNPTPGLGEVQVQTETTSSQDAASLDALDQDIENTDTNTGVDTNAIN